ncbi:hypothetical protein [Streptomyces tendae]
MRFRALLQHAAKRPPKSANRVRQSPAGAVGAGLHPATPSAPTTRSYASVALSANVMVASLDTSVTAVP